VSELNLILLGPPGAGKGTQATRLRKDFDLAYIPTGDLLREHRSNETELGVEAAKYMADGKLVPDDLVIAMILEKIEEEGRDGFLLDGFPRTVGQAGALDAELDALGRRLTAVLLIEVPDDEIVRRLSGRRVSRSGRVYHVEFDPPKVEGIDDVDGTELVQREDDRPETIRKRLQVFHEQTAPLIDFYEQRGQLRRFDGTRSPTEVHDHIRAAISTLRLEDSM
jgi:adenylate kinase